MVEVRFADGVWAPVIICDVCSTRISDSSQANAIWSTSDYSGCNGPVLHVHKDCDDRVAAEPPIAWAPLADHLFYVCHNARLTPTKLAEVGRFIKQTAKHF